MRVNHNVPYFPDLTQASRQVRYAHCLSAISGNVDVGGNEPPLPDVVRSADYDREDQTAANLAVRLSILTPSTIFPACRDPPFDNTVSMQESGNPSVLSQTLPERPQYLPRTPEGVTMLPGQEELEPLTPTGISPATKTELELITDMLDTQDLNTSFARFAVPGESRVQSKDRQQSIRRFTDGMRFMLRMPRHLRRTKLSFAQSTQAKPIEVFPYPRLLYIPDNDAGDYSDDDILIDYYDEDQDYTLQLPPSKLTPPYIDHVARNYTCHEYNIDTEIAVSCQES
jgi:hypothetical protein